MPLKRLQEWVVTLNVARRSRDRLREAARLRRGEGRLRGDRLAYVLPRRQGRDHRRSSSRDAQAQPDQSDRGLGGWHVAFELTPAGGDRFEEVTEQEPQAPLRYRPRRHGRERARHPEQDPRRHAARSRMGSGEPRRAARGTRRSSSWCSAPARCPRPSRPSNEQLIGPSLGEDAIAQGLKGGARRRHPRARVHGRSTTTARGSSRTSP